jgi:D-amino-acid dehydrogenase
MPQPSLHVPSLHVVVIGAGIVGAVSAVELLRDGHRVTIVEAGEPGGEQAASYGNAGGLSTSSVLPMTAPGIWRQVPGYLADPLGPLAIRWSYLPRLLPWLWRFVRAGSNEAKLRKIARAMRPLVAGCPARHVALATEAGVADLIQRNGLLYVYPGRADFAKEALAWDIRRENGIAWLELDANDLRQREPDLDRRYTFGVLVEDGGQCRNPGRYVAALVELAQARGATLKRGDAAGFAIESGRLRAVRLDGEEIACDRAVIAAGARSKHLAAMVGDDVPLETERGYHVMLAAPEAGTRRPVMPSDGKMVYTSMEAGLRCAGQVELAGLDAAPNWKRADILRDHLLRGLPALPRDLPESRVKLWMGHRPSLPDSLPCIGPASGCADVLHAYGHGHIGLAASAVTGRLVADLIGGHPQVIDPAPYAPSRFR